MDVGRSGRNDVAADRMIVAYSRSNGAAANHEIAWVTVALQHLSVGEPFLGPDRILCTGGCRPYGSAGAARARGRARVPACLGELSLASGHGAVMRPRV